MSVSLEEALNGAGYNLSDPEDCEWLLGKEEEFDELINKAQNVIDLWEEYNDEKDTADEDGDPSFPSFSEWCDLKGEEND